MSPAALLALPLQLAAVAAPPVHHGLRGQLDVRAPRLERTIEVDGRLDEPVWREAAILTGFSLYQPVDGRPAPDSTEVLVWYSADAMHFGVRAFEPHGAVRATLADRDRVSTDDYVELHLDTFDERRRALVFIVNPLGVQADGTKSEGGGFIPGANVAPGQNDLSADFQWRSKGRVTDWGYEVELRIPFSSIRYALGSPQRWGLQVVRRVQHSGYEQTWTPAKRGSASFIAQAGHLVGLSGMRHGQVVELNPELTNTTAGSASASDPGWRYANDANLGGNVRWGMGSDFVLNGTIRPDFSQVEADATQIATDQRFALFYPERRPFFVEGSDQFNVPNTLVYTRRIVRPEAAAKFTGKIGRNDVALLSAADDRATTADGSRPLVGIVRLRRDLGTQSTAGVLYSGRTSGARDNHVAGADARLVFGGLYYAQLQAVGSVTSQDGVRRVAPMWEAAVDRTGRNFGFHYALLGIAPDFQTDNGFVPRTGFVQPSVNNRFTAFGRPGGFLERYNVFLQTSALWRYEDFFDGRGRLEHRLSASNQLTFRRGWSATVTPALGSFAFDPANYGGLWLAGADGAAPTAFVPAPRTGTTLGTFAIATPQFRRFAASAGTTVGNDVDFLETSRVRRHDWNASLDLRPSERLRVGATFVASSFTRRRDGARIQSLRIPRVRAEYQVARPVLVRVVSQYESTRRAPLRDPRTGGALLVAGATPGSFAPSPERRGNALRTDWLFAYRPTPGTVVFAGYGNTLTEPGALAFQDLRRVNDALFVKLSYLFRMRSGA
ncbi:DUF5916 domain-containing protein [Roseisolibacter sp. H3M3-2]|uniref:carbohydrate binding family 9 domain-containing protein n=1 Tax=Roseisolibacter sp. H3M3-2 TaxID=3031323 RepID=UPI0023D9B9A9|nr:DUF5916 domain-containing protein [Roseisolibacter sp. H3M3-2]MDF1503189.1 DUF5916 domain-containing protein [Roseisolibacter sp. H3M3-2]